MRVKVVYFDKDRPPITYVQNILTVYDIVPSYDDGSVIIEYADREGKHRDAVINTDNVKLLEVYF